ncbi:MAG: sulfite exporter TauE/SafE family protein [Acidimicrobiia bacterium]|nr:sulfite exporter TauE/SafE family protein [Acidimicrobiia bacterium]
MEIIAFILLGLFAGFLAATLGIGGGIIFVPAFVSLFAFSQLDAQGTSLAIIVPTAVIATIGHARAGRVVWKVAAVTGLAGVGGAVLGSLLAFELDETVLRRIFAVVLVILAIRMFIRAVRLRQAESATDGS